MDRPSKNASRTRKKLLVGTEDEGEIVKKKRRTKKITKQKPRRSRLSPLFNTRIVN